MNNLYNLLITLKKLSNWFDYNFRYIDTRWCSQGIDNGLGYVDRLEMSNIIEHRKIAHNFRADNSGANAL